MIVIPSKLRPPLQRHLPPFKLYNINFIKVTPFPHLAYSKFSPSDPTSPTAAESHSSYPSSFPPSSLQQCVSHTPPPPLSFGIPCFARSSNAGAVICTPHTRPSKHVMSILPPVAATSLSSSSNPSTFAVRPSALNPSPN